MHSKVDDRLVLSSDGREVAVSGPITQWDDDEKSATFAVVIAQLDENGEIVLAGAGRTGTYGTGHDMEGHREGAGRASAHRRRGPGLGARIDRRDEREARALPLVARDAPRKRRRRAAAAH